VADLEELDLLALDRELGEAVRRWRLWRRKLRQGEGFDEHPLYSHSRVSGRSVFGRLLELEQDPLAAPLRRWVYRLAEQRFNHAPLALLERARRVETRAVDEPERGRFTMSALLRRALTERGQRSAWLEALIQQAEPLTNLAALVWERRAELAERFGLVSADALELPSPETFAVAEAFLERSADLMWSEIGRGDAGRLLETALAETAREGWPSRIVPRTLSELFSDTRLLEALELDPGPFPPAIAPASYLRALGRLGAAWADATAPKRQPFAIAHDAYGLRRYTHGALFAGLPLGAVFLRRKLGLGQERARDHARALGRSLLIAARLAALRVLLRSAAQRSRAAYEEAFEAESERVLGISIPGRAAGALIRLEPDDPQRFCGLLLAARKTAELVSEHDEDWFRNPRAIDRLRSEAELSPETSVERATLDMASELAFSALCEVAA